MAISKPCAQNSNVQIEIPSKEVYLASDNIHSSCVSNGNTLTLYSNEGQTLNITMIDINDNDAPTDQIYGTINDPANDNRIMIESGPRKRNLMSTLSNTVEISLQSSSPFLLHVIGELIH